MKVLTFLIASIYVCGQGMSPGPGVKAYAAGTAPTAIQNKGCGISFGSPGTCTFGSNLTAGDIIGYIVSTVGANATTYTISDNCGGTYTTDQGPTTLSNPTPTVQGTVQMGHATGSSGACTVTYAWTGANGSGSIFIWTVRGSSGIDVSSALNPNYNVGTSANAIASSAATTVGNNALCYGAEIDVTENGGTITAGSTTVAWTLGVAFATVASANEWFAVTSSGTNLTAHFTTNTAFTAPMAGLICFKP